MADKDQNQIASPAGQGGFYSFFINMRQFNPLLRAMRRQSEFFQVPFTQGLVSSLILLRENQRSYFIIQNTHATANIYVGFGFMPTPVTGLKIIPGGNYEPIQVPTNEVYIVSDTAGATGVAIYAR
jgi:hypothetical protein